MKSLCGCLAVAALFFGTWFLLCSTHQHRPGEAHLTEIDLEFGKYTKEQIAEFESRKPDSSLSTKTPPTNLDGGHTNDILTIVVDFKDSGQGVTTDVFGNETGAFDVTEYGFLASEFQAVVDAIMDEVQEDFFDELIGTVANDGGMELEIQVIEGDIGTAPPGITEYYFVQVGTGLEGPHTFALGVAAGSSVRDSSGDGPNFGIEIGDVVASVFTDNIQGLSGLDPPDALSSGNLIFSRNAVVGTLSHEIGHVVSLSHINLDMSVQPTPGAAPIMATGAIDLPTQLRLTDREFSLMGFNAQNGNEEVFHIAQLVDAVGLTGSGAGPLENIGLNVLSGIQNGNLDQLANDDSSVLGFAAEPAPAPVQFEVVASSPTTEPPNLALTFESRCNTLNMMQIIEVFNVDTGEFDVVSKFAPTLNFQIVEVDLSADAASYVDPGNCQLVCRVSYEPVGPVLMFPWRVELDQLFFEIN